METGLVPCSLYLLELFGFSLVTDFCRVQTWRAWLLGWFELVLLAEVVLPFTSAAEKRSGLADHTSSQEAKPDGNWSLVCLLLVSLMCVCSPVASLCGSNACANTDGTEDWDKGTVSASSGSSISLLDHETGCDASMGLQTGQGTSALGGRVREKVQPFLSLQKV